MNTDVANEISQAYLGFWYTLLAGVGLYFIKVIIAILLKRRVSPLVAPGLLETDNQTFFPRLLSLMGMNAAPAQTFAARRLRATIGLRLLMWGAVFAMVYFHHQMGEQLISFASIIVALVGINAVHIELYEIEYDKVEMVLPRWWFGHTSHRWRDLVAVTDKDPWLATLHFADGRRVKVHKYIVGFPEFMAVAKDAIRNL
jgi:hypothetical protein